MISKRTVKSTVGFLQYSVSVVVFYFAVVGDSCVVFQSSFSFLALMHFLVSNYFHSVLRSLFVLFLFPHFSSTLDIINIIRTCFHKQFVSEKEI